MISRKARPAVGQSDYVNIIGPLWAIGILRLLGLTGGAKKVPGFPASGDPEDINDPDNFEVI
jgi:hypothetical protein